MSQDDTNPARGGEPVDEHHRVVIVGGGNAGISVAAQLQRKLKGLDIAIIEPSEKHYYQPLWTLVGAGAAKKEATVRDEGAVIPKNVEWIRERVVQCCPEQDAVMTASGRRIGYDYLVMAPGIQINWHLIPGLEEALGKDGVCSNYSYESVDSTWESIRSFTGGTAIFTQPNTPVKCGGAPQKIAYLADDAFRKQGVRDRTDLIFASAGASIFGVQKYAKTLNQVVQRKGIDTRFRHNLVELHADAHEAVFEQLDTGERVTLHYDMIHVVPPMSAPDFVRQSPLANADGWVEVDKHTLRHPRYANVFGLGDASSLPTSKTGAAVRKQAPVLVRNLVGAILGRETTASYDGYTACPLVTGYGKLVMAEFDYDMNPRETFPFDQSKERWSMYQFKKYVLPRLYWQGILKGRA